MPSTAPVDFWQARAPHWRQHQWTTTPFYSAKFRPDSQQFVLVKNHEIPQSKNCYCDGDEGTDLKSDEYFAFALYILTHKRIYIFNMVYKKHIIES